MTVIEIILIVLLAASLVSLVYSWRRRRSADGSRKPSMIPEASRVSEMVRGNCVHGAIQQVASRVSDCLINDLACDRILFLRKKRGVLELNYYHNIRGFNRREFRSPVTGDLEQFLAVDLTPRPIQLLKTQLPE